MTLDLNPIVDDISEALSIFINQIVYDKKNNGERVYTFSLGEAFFDIPRFSINDDTFKIGYHYSSSMGQLSLRKKISNMYKNCYGVDVNPENECLVSAGSKVIIYMLLQVVLNNGDEVIIHEPAWLSYKEQIKLVGGVCVPIPYSISIRSWEKYITNKTKLIIINNPNNPSGQLYTKEELELLFNVAEKNGIYVLSDEAYSDFLLKQNKFISFANIDKKKEHCLVVNSLSKNMGMSGWRVGYAISHKEIISRLLKLNQHIITCAPTVLQNYMAEHFDEILQSTIPQAMDMARKRFEVQKLCENKAIKVLNGVGTFYLFIDVSRFKGTTEELVFDLLFKKNIATVPGAAYGESTKDFIRFGIGIESLEDISKCLDVINEYLNLEKYDNSEIKEIIKASGYNINL